MAKKHNTEFETKVPHIDVDAVVEKLRSLGAKETPEYLSRRYVFDMDSENSEWIRLRTNGEKTTIAYKYKVIGNTEVGKTIEIEVEVSDFDKTAEIFKKLSFKRVFYQENKNHLFHLHGIEFSIDRWPFIDPYLEIEAESKEKVEEGLRLLGLEGKDVGDLDVGLLFDEKGIDIHSYSELRFPE